MRVCLILPGFSSSESDWCIPALRDLVRRMASDAEPWVLALRYPFEAADYSVDGVAVRSLGTGNRGGPARVTMFGFALAAVLAEHRRRPFDVVHGLWADEAGLLASICGRLLGRPAVVSVMGGELVWFADLGYGLQGSRLGRSIVARSLRWAGAVTVGSVLLEPRVASATGGGPARRLPLGVDVERFRPDGAGEDLDGDPALLSVASLTPVKEQSLLLAAFAEVSARLPGARLHIVGDGPLRAELVERASALGVSDRVSFHGAVPNDRLPPLYRSADLHLVSSRFESQCVAAVEAAACGTGTVGSEVGVLPELGAGARTVPVGSASALAAGLLEVLGDPSAAAAMGCAALEVARRRFNLDRCTDGFLQLYLELSRRE